MVKCWNCELLLTVYFGEPSKGKLFATKYYRCKVKGTVLEEYYKLHEERQCDKYEEARFWLKK